MDEYERGLLLVKLLFEKYQLEPETEYVARYFDVNVEVDGEVFVCDRAILASRSLYFECLFNGNFKEANASAISLPREYVNRESFSKLLDAMYGEPLKMEDDIASLFVACSYLQMNQFMDECEKYIIKNVSKIDLSKLIALPQFKERSSLCEKAMKYVCQDFSEIHSKLIRLPYPVLEELLGCIELLVFSRIDALKFCKVWLSHYRSERKIYRGRIYRLLEPFRNHDKPHHVNRCKRYIYDELSPKEVVKLFRKPSFKEDDPLYAPVRNYICENFSAIHHYFEMFELSFRSFSDLLSNVRSFVLARSARHVVDFGCVWLNHDKTSRRKYTKKVERLMKPFINFVCREDWCSWDDPDDYDPYGLYDSSYTDSDSSNYDLYGDAYPWLHHMDHFYCHNDDNMFTLHRTYESDYDDLDIWET